MGNQCKRCTNQPNEKDIEYNHQGLNQEQKLGQKENQVQPLIDQKKIILAQSLPPDNLNKNQVLGNQSPVEISPLSQTPPKQSDENLQSQFQKDVQALKDEASKCDAVLSFTVTQVQQCKQPCLQETRCLRFKGCKHNIYLQNDGNITCMEREQNCKVVDIQSIKICCKNQEEQEYAKSFLREIAMALFQSESIDQQKKPKGSFNLGKHILLTNDVKNLSDNSDEYIEIYSS